MPIARKPIYIGIDPGKTGAIAILCSDVVMVSKIPETDKDILHFFGLDWDSAFAQRPTFARLEKVGGFVKGNPTPGGAMFSFGVGYGLLRMGLTAAKIPFEEVTPQKWIKGLGLGTRGNRTDTEWKAYLYQKAQQLYPSASFPKYAADAVLIATFCKRKTEGTL